MIPLICKRDIEIFINLNFSLTTPKIFAIVGIKAVHFSLYSFLSCLIISGLLRLVSLVKLSEEAGLQFFGPDNVAILKIRLIVVSTSSLITLALINESGNFEHVLYSDTILKEVYFKHGKSFNGHSASVTFFWWHQMALVIKYKVPIYILLFLFQHKKRAPTEQR